MEKTLPASARGFDPWSRKMPHAAEQHEPVPHGQEQPHARKPSSSTEDPVQPNANRLVNFKKSNSERHSVPERALYTSYVAKETLNRQWEGEGQCIVAMIPWEKHRCACDKGKWSRALSEGWTEGSPFCLHEALNLHMSQWICPAHCWQGALQSPFREACLAAVLRPIVSDFCSNNSPIFNKSNLKWRLPRQYGNDLQIMRKQVSGHFH